MTKETYIYDKEDLHILQKRPTHIECAKLYDIWDIMCALQKFFHMTKEAYIYDKRDLHICDI